MVDSMNACKLEPRATSFTEFFKKKKHIDNAIDEDDEAGDS